ncbi:MAG: hypothetical protein H5T78_02365 [Nocardia sp.]|nr:hypothetical protein [Nocardia sp.]
MCRSKHTGGRRCPNCGSVAAAMKANGNRRLGRLARKKVVDHLKNEGLVETAAAVLAAPPSMLPELMAGLGIDPKILGDTPMPSDHANPPSAKLLIALAQAERDKLAGPKITPAQAAVEAAEVALAAAEQERYEAHKKVNRLRSHARTAAKAAEADQADQAKMEEAVAKKAAVYVAKAEYAEAVTRKEHAEDDLAAAKYGLREDLATDAERDAYLATLTDDDVEAIARSVNRSHAADAAAALGESGPVALAGTARDTTVYTTAKLPLETGDGVNIVEGRVLDGDTAIYRRYSGDFMVLQKKGDAYHPVASAGSKHDALTKASRIPILSPIAQPGADAAPMQKQAYETKADLILELAGKAASGKATTPEAQQAIIDAGMSEAQTKLADSVGGGLVRAEVFDGAKRHKRAMREKAANEAGEKARTAALAAGATKSQADAAYAKARRSALGTPTRGGGTIPHFDHGIPPGTLGEEKYKNLARSGIRAWGKETSTDYAVIGQRAGNLAAWGFNTSGGQVKTSSISTLTSSNAEFVQKELTGKERSALRTYTGGSYRSINAAITGRDSSPAPSVKSTVAQLESAFDKFGEKNPNMTPMTVMRGTKVPSGWKGTTDEYLDSAFTVGARVEIGKVTSCSTRQQTAVNFAGHPPYMMVIRTRDGLPVKSISQYSGEDEVVIPPGANLRCVKVEKNGVAGRPTVYLVAEDLVAEAEDQTYAAAA